MSRKDCDISSPAHGTTPTDRRFGTGALVERTTSSDRHGQMSDLRCRFGLIRTLLVVACLTVLTQSAFASGRSIRVFPSAVVVGDTIRIADLCELRGFPRVDEQTLGDVIIGEAPRPGGSRIVHIDRVRSVLSGAGANLATLTLSGAITCSVQRPAVPITQPSAEQRSFTTRKQTGTLARKRAGTLDPGPLRSSSQPTAGGATLRDAVLEYFHGELFRYGGRAEVIFDSGAQNMLQLSEPEYSFAVRRRGGRILGLTSIEVDVLARDQRLQTIPLVVEVSMLRESLVARRTINEGATIRPDDVGLVSMSFSRVNRLGIGDPILAIGQRAKRIIRSGALVESGLLEPVPLVRRGQLVTLISASGSVRVVTTGKAASDGLLGEVIKVRSVDDKRSELDAVVVGVGKVQIGEIHSRGVAGNAYSPSLSPTSFRAGDGFLMARRGSKR